MSLKENWKDKVDGQDDILAEDINSIAQAVIHIEGLRQDIVIEELFYDTSGIEITDPSLFEFDKETGTILKYIGTEGSVVVVPYEIDGVKVTSVGGGAFSNSLASVVLPKTITTIGYNAFGSNADNKSITSIAIPDSVTSIGNMAFQNCGNLTNITIPDSVISIGAQAFQFSNLTEIIIPASVTSIGFNAFLYCKNLTSATISPSVTTIGEGAFAGCNEGLVIKCAEGSYADAYAQENGIAVEYTNEVTKKYVDKKVGEIGDLEDLTTTDKSNLVAAINEVNAGFEVIITATTTDDGFTLYPPEQTYAEIIEALQWETNNSDYKGVKARFENDADGWAIDLPDVQCGVGDDNAPIVFSGTYGQNAWSFSVTYDNKCSYSVKTLADKDYVDEKSVVYVTANGTWNDDGTETVTLDMTYGEIRDTFDEGKQVFLHMSLMDIAITLPLVYGMSSPLVFSSLVKTNDESVVYYATLDRDNVFEYKAETIISDPSVIPDKSNLMETSMLVCDVEKYKGKITEVGDPNIIYWTDINMPSDRTIPAGSKFRILMSDGNYHIYTSLYNGIINTANVLFTDDYLELSLHNGVEEEYDSAIRPVEGEEITIVFPEKTLKWHPLGDIETALDGIIAIQNQLMGVSE